MESTISEPPRGGHEQIEEGLVFLGLWGFWGFGVQGFRGFVGVFSGIGFWS